MKNLMTLVVSLFFIGNVSAQTEFEEINTPEVSNIASFDINFRGQILAYDTSSEFRLSGNGGVTWIEPNLPETNHSHLPESGIKIKAMSDGDFMILSSRFGTVKVYQPLLDTFFTVDTAGLGIVNDLVVQGNGNILFKNKSHQVFISYDLAKTFKKIFDIKDLGAAYEDSGILDLIAADPDQAIYHLHFGRPGGFRELAIIDDLGSPIETGLFYRNSFVYHENNILKHPNGYFIFTSPSGEVYFSPNGINDWEQMDNLFSGIIHGFFINDRGEMFIFTEDGIRTKDIFPVDWVPHPNEMISPEFNNSSIYIKKHPFEDQVFFNVKTADGSCFQITNNRLTSWSNSKTVSGTYNTKGIKTGPGNKLYAFIGNGCMISHDQGNTWHAFHIEKKGVVDLIFDPSGYTYAATANNSFYLLPPNSSTWRKYTPHNFGLSRYHNTKIFRGKTGYLLYSWNPGTYISYDNGTNWKPINPSLYNLTENNLAFDTNGDFYTNYGGFLSRHYSQGDSLEVLYATDSDSPMFISDDGTKIFPRSKSDPGAEVSRMYLPGDTTYTMVNPPHHQVYLDTNNVGIYLTDEGLDYSTNYFDAPELLSDLDNINSFYLDEDYTLYLARNNGKIMRSKGSADIKRQVLDVTAYWDKNGDCEIGPEDEPLKNLTLSFNNGERIIERTTDENGKIWMEYGNCFIEKEDELNFWESCAPVVYVNFSERFDTIQVDYLVKAEPACPYLSAGMGTPFFNSCEEAIYWIGYDNMGIIKSENTRLEIRLDPRLEYVASQVALTDLGNNQFELAIGDFEEGEKETFWLKVKTPCDTSLIGTAFCSEVEIFPKNNCLPIDKIEGPYFEAKAECLGDSVRFSITNIGERNMLQSQEYYWMAIENYPKVHKSKPFKLRKNESLNFKIPAEGLTYRVEVNQPDGVYDKYTTVNIEGCGGSNISKGYFNSFGHQEGKLTYDLDCRVLTGLEEPNGFSFQVEPEGAGSEREIPSNIDLEHEIVLFNKGTTQLDSGLVFVEIITSTNQPIYFSNKTLADGLKTNNLALKPYAENPDESYLYIKFKPFPISNLPAGNYLPHFAIQNISGSNNQFLLKIRGDYDNLTSEEQPILNKSISIAPNPMKEQALINLDGTDFTKGKHCRIEIYNLNGQMVETQTFLGSKFYLSRNGLPSRIYFFRISQEGRALAMGQIIMQ
jgi:hypothetical protein